MRTTCLIVLVAASLPAVGQTTWQGLEFGMGREKISEILAAKKFSLDPSSGPGLAYVSPDFELATNSLSLDSSLNASVASASAFYKPALQFDKAGGLIMVTLSLDQARSFQATPALHTNLPMLGYVASTSIYEQLSSKYGAPATTRGPCAHTELGDFITKTMECSSQWSTGSQSIELFWQFDPNSNLLDLVVKYSSVTPSL